MGFCLIAGLLLLPAMWFYLDRLGHQQSERLGHILVTQLAEQAWQPLLHQDTISLQVVVNNMVRNTDYVLRAAIFDVENQLQAQSSSGQPQPDEHSSYRHSIALENKAAGHAELTLDVAHIEEDVATLFWSLLFTWLLLSALLCVALGMVGGNISRRLSNIIAGLPTQSAPVLDDEIAQLEANIKPLLVKPQTSNASDDEDRTSLTLTICCENIQRLQAQLTQENFRHLLEDFEAVADCTVKLFAATRLPGSQNCMHLRFYCEGDKDNALLRAVSCYTAISDMVRASAPRKGTGLALCAALRATDQHPEDSQFLQDQQHELTLQKLVKTTAFAEPWQLLIQASLLENTETENSILYELLLNAEDQVLFTALGAEQQATLARQLHYIRSQLPELATPSISGVAS